MRCDAESLCRVRSVFIENFERGLECGSALSIWQDGVEKLHLEQGFLDTTGHRAWDADTLVLVWSATKGPASACVAHALAAAGVDPARPVASVWPEFAAAGKADLRFVDVMSHRAGLCALQDHSARFDDHEQVALALAGQGPLWMPGTTHGYGPRVFGYLMDEIIRRVSGIPLGEYWSRHFSSVHDLDFFIGLPEADHPRVARTLPPRASAFAGEKTAFQRAMTTPGTLTYSAFTTPTGLASVSAMNAPAVRSSTYPAFGGIGSARGLAKFYSLLATGELFDAATRGSFASRTTNGFDQVLQLETAFSFGFMLDPLDNGQKIRSTFGPSLSAFGHPGAGGALAFADPEHRIGFAYVMNQMEPGALPRERTSRIVRALY